MKIRRQNILYFLLLMAYLNAVLRINAESSITAFRALLPISMIEIYLCSRGKSTLLIELLIGAALIALIQYALTKYIFYPEITTYTIKHLVEYLFHVFSILVVIFLVLCLKEIDSYEFEQKFVAFGALFVKVIVAIYCIYIFLGNAPNRFLLFGNINDFGCVMTIGIGIIYFEHNTLRLFKYIWISLILFLLLYNDSKLAFFGAVIGIGLLIIGRVSDSGGSGIRQLFKYLAVVIGIVSIGILFNSSFVINGYNIRVITLEPIKKILSGEYYSHSSSSVAFRSNVVMALLSILRRTFALGVGFGNTGLILKQLVPDSGLVFSNYSYMASHIWWLEVMCDMGWIAIIPLLKVFLSSWKMYVKSTSSIKRQFSIIFIMTFPIWSMSSSGLYTEYFTLSFLAFSYLQYRTLFLNRKNDEVE